jgi:MFS-type transporter involved in bile tolerance (Atg22 family)
MGQSFPNDGQSNSLKKRLMDSNKTDTSDFEDIKINIKIKLSALWTSVTFLYIYGDYFELYVPDKVSGIISGHSMLDSPVKLFAAAALLAIPALMICLSVILKSPLNRQMNMLFGVFFTVIMLVIAVISISEWRTFYVFYAIVESVLTSIIVWHAWKWARQKIK